MENTDKHWRLWGELDPYRGVCYPQGLAPDFWESGETYVKALLAEISSVERGSALDFGCGVGRILLPLSKQFAHVTGVDISAAMLAHARSNVPGAELLDHIPSTQFDLVHSCLVLQHIPVKRGLEIIRLLRECVDPAGVLAIQIPLEVQHSWIYRIKHALPGARFVFNALQGKPLRQPLMQMNAYSPVDIAATLNTEDTAEICWIDNPPCEGNILVWRRNATGTQNFEHHAQVAERNGAVDQD